VPAWFSPIPPVAPTEVESGSSSPKYPIALGGRVGPFPAGRSVWVKGRQEPVVVVVVAVSVALHPVDVEHVVLQECVAAPDVVLQTTEQDEAVTSLHSVEEDLLVVEGQSVDKVFVGFFVTEG
jgi:hypothetical protein